MAKKYGKGPDSFTREDGGLTKYALQCGLTEIRHEGELTIRLKLEHGRYRVWVINWRNPKKFLFSQFFKHLEQAKAAFHEQRKEAGKEMTQKVNETDQKMAGWMKRRGLTRVGRIGDVNPLEHGGGQILQTPDGHGYLMLLVPEEGEENAWKTYAIDLPRLTKDEMKREFWFASLPLVAKMIGFRSQETLAEFLLSSQIMERAIAYQALAQYHGLENFDPDPDVHLGRFWEGARGLRQVFGL